MSGIEGHISADAASLLRGEIAAAGGREVFFLGHVNEDGVVVSAEVLARGTDVSVAAITQAGAYGDVAIHNHPGAVLEPSEADVTVSSLAACSGIASFIINNDVTAVYVLVEPMKPPQLKPLDAGELLGVLSAGGPMGKALQNYEERPAQKEMMAEVIDSFNHDKIAVIEAGTGTGKTVAYLIPSIAWAVTNDERVVVSTHTINLQEQILHKDLPLVRKIFMADFKAVLVKGRNNYVCLRKAHLIEEDPELFEDDDAAELHALLAWAFTTKTGDIADLNFMPRHRVWEKVQSTPETCLRAHCPYFRECFIGLARREAATAQLLITNHALLFSDIAIHAENGVFSDSTILPKYRRVILDEAHNLEEVATRHFGASVSRHGYNRALNTLYRHARGRETGSLMVLAAQLVRCEARGAERGQVDAMAARLNEVVMVSIPAVQFSANDVFDAVAAEVARARPDEAGTVQYRLTPERRAEDMWLRLQEHMMRLVAATRLFVKGVAEIIADVRKLALEDEKVAGALLDVEAHLGWLTSYAATLDAVCNDDSDQFVNWLEARVTDTVTYVSVERAPLDVADAMVQNVFEQYPTIVMTSATLTSRKTFDFFEKRCGLAQYRESFSKDPDVKKKARPVRAMVLPTPFDFKRQAAIVIPTDIDAAHFDAKSTMAGHGHSLRDAVRTLLDITNGSAFVLFTSYGLLRKMAREMEDDLAARGMNLLVQGSGGRDELLKRFRSESHAVLFGTDSFWAGVDVVGEALQSVIITKLPFRVPTEPVIEARAEYIDAHNGNSFTEYTIPLAVIKFRQGFGRLIRSASDYGMVAVLDRRVIEKYYGKWFLQSLPECAQMVGPLDELVAQASAFLTQHREAYALRRTPGAKAAGHAAAQAPPPAQPAPRPRASRRRAKDAG
ncbi:DEAD/DEAH box helicase [bacterium]|nr:DEAD/DEAH box helicase [bacterium]